MSRVWIMSGALVVSQCAYLACGQSSSSEVRGFDAIESRLDDLMEKKAYGEALVLLESVSAETPEHDYEMMAYRAEIYAHEGQYEKSLDIWEEGLDKGMFFGIRPEWDFYKPFEKYERFARIAERDRQLREAADKESKSIVEVVAPPLPMNATRKRTKLPLFIALHGGGSSIRLAERYWKSQKLNKEFVVAFIQSYLHDGMKSYGWRRYDPRARQEIQALVKDVVEEYPVDQERIIVGGISAGGSMAIDVAINHVIPTAGFIGVCPGKPLEFDSACVRAAREDGVKGVIIGGEDDFYLPYQKEMVRVFKEERFPHEFIVIPGMGHTYPDDFPSHIDSAIDFILRLKNGNYPQKYSPIN